MTSHRKREKFVIFNIARASYSLFNHDKLKRLDDMSISDIYMVLKPDGFRFQILRGQFADGTPLVFPRRGAWTEFFEEPRGRDGGVPKKCDKHLETLKRDIARLIKGQKELEHRERLLTLVMEAVAKFEAGAALWSSMAMEVSRASAPAPTGISDLSRLSEEALEASARIYERVRKRVYRTKKKAANITPVKKLTQG